ncbi:MAG: nitroreductase family deazaflavin-dependent oxidoreductase [Oscillochloris sp.]|nr:nitroreductase family deazaflavin-dependent oxidoreductase [Oscillochloris sp.]
MSASNDRVDRILREGFRIFNRYMVLLWRIGLGPSLSLTPKLTGRYLMLAHTGRKSGLRRLTPLNYAEVNGTIYITAGFGTISDWYRNIIANPQVEIWLPDGHWNAHIEELADDHAERLALLREVLKGSGFVAPLMGVNPYTLSDEALTEASAAYRIIAIIRDAKILGPSKPGDPNDLTWVWPAGIALISMIALFRILKPRQR